MIRAAIYARYSSDLQSDSSIEDQVRLCRRKVEQEGWSEVDVFTDHATSGASTLRPGYQTLLESVRNGQIDIIVAEALDRLSRDLSDIAGLHKQLKFLGVQLETISEGQITDLHVGLKGTMNALFLKDLADKTRRGLEGRVRQGKSGGGNAYGYDVVRKFSTDGAPVRGERIVNDIEAGIVRRIFEEFAAGRSPRAIAHDLNAERIPGPRSTAWGPSTIHGNWRRGTGILNNEMYIGRLVWNRQRYIKDPTTGKRQARLNPEAEWIIENVHELRIIEDDLWQSVKERQQGTRRAIAEDRGIRSERARRPRYLLSGLLECGTCGGGYSKISENHYGCSTARNKGTCNNHLSIRRDIVEQAVLQGLKEQLMQPAAYDIFAEELTREINRLAAAEDVEREQLGKEIKKAEKGLSRLIEAIKSGVPGEAVKDEIASIESRKAELIQRQATAPAQRPRLHPNLASMYRGKVEGLVDALNASDTLSEATAAVRGLVEKVRLIPENGELKIELYGELAALLSLGMKQKNKHPTGNTDGVQVTLVAGRGFVEEPTVSTKI